MLKDISVRLVAPEERHQQLMRAHHYLGSVRKIGETLWTAHLCRPHCRSR
jgi:hypothetical protein